MAASKAPLKDEYILTRDFHAMTRYVESPAPPCTYQISTSERVNKTSPPMDRLNYQHFLLREQYGYLLHPNIPTDHEDGMTIADVGTGTA